MPDYSDAFNNLSHRYQPVLLLLIMLLFLLVAPIVRADSVRARIVADKERILIGDAVQLKIEIAHQAKTEYQLKLDEKGLPFCELRGQPRSSTHLIDGQSAETEIELTIVPFQTGKLPLPPFVLINSDGGQLQTPALELEVTAISAPQERTIKDVRLLPSPPAAGWLQPVIVALLLTSAALYWLVRVADPYITAWALALIGRLAARTEAAAVAPVAVRVSLEEETIGKLRLLLASGLAQADIKRFHVQLADIMTGYAIARYQAAPQEYTSAELLFFLKEQGVPLLVTSAFEQILSICDLVKFARFQPEVEAAHRTVRQAIDLLKALNLGAEMRSPLDTASAANAANSDKGRGAVK